MKPWNYALALALPLTLLGVACGNDDADNTGNSQGGSDSAGSGGSDAGKGGSAGSTAGKGGSGGSGGTAAGAGGSGAGAGGTAAGAGGSVAGASGAGGATAGASGAGGATAGAGGAGGATAGAGGAGGAMPTKGGSVSFGVVSVTEIQGLPNPIVGNAASASFFDNTGAGGSAPDCSTEVFGDCKLTTCNLGGAGGSAGSGGAAGAPAALSAGDITFTGGAVTPVAVKLKDLSGTQLYQADPALPTDKGVLVGGETIKVEATGKDVPAFSFEMTAPKSVKVDGFPTATPGMSVAVDTTKDLVLSMSGGGEGTVSVIVSASSTTKNALLICSVPASSSSVTLKTDALKKVKEVDSKGSFIGSLSSLKVNDVSGWSIAYSLLNVLHDKDDKPLPAFSQVTF